MKRREFTAGIAALALAGSARAQRARRSYRIGALLGGGQATMGLYRAALRDRLATHGFVEGKNLHIVAKGAIGDSYSDRNVALELLADRPDVLFTCLTAGTLAAQAATRKVPIVFVWVADPVAIGIVSNLRRPGGNTTGVTNRFGELLLKRLELTRELLPAAKRVAILGTTPTGIYAALAPSCRAAAAKLQFELIEQPFLGMGWGRVAERAVQAGAEALLPFAHFAAQGFLTSSDLVQFALDKRVPLVLADSESVEVGGLISYGTNIVDDVRRGADLVARVLKGEKVGEIAVDQPSRFELVVNQKTARAIGVAVPSSVLLRADRVIE